MGKHPTKKPDYLEETMDNALKKAISVLSHTVDPLHTHIHTQPKGTGV